VTSQHAPFLVDVESLRARAEAIGIDLPLVIWDESCPSTNDALAALVHHPAEATASSGVVRGLAGDAPAAELAELTILGTDFQSAGHGRLGRTWTVPPRRSLTFSILLAPTTPVRTWGWIPLITGEAVRAAIAEAGVPAVLKWPNDVLTAEGRKLCGILARIETTPEGPRIVLGMGTNTRLEPADLPREDASSLAIELGVAGSEIDHERLLLSILGTLVPGLRELAEYGEDFGRSPFAARVRAGMVTLGTRVKVERPDGSFLVGEATGLDATGDLVIDDAVSVSAGDVHHLRPAAPAEGAGSASGNGSDGGAGSDAGAASASDSAASATPPDSGTTQR
jgi:BirA family biotin operon repressor/biotin-[acetyl-CoA-carboxylase] ligase